MSFLTKARGPLLAEYRKRIEEKREIFQSHISELPLSLEASQKYTSTGRPMDYYGVSLVYFLSQQTAVYKKLHSMRKELQSQCEQAEIAQKLYFLPLETYHITLFDIAVLYPPSIEAHIFQTIETSLLEVEKMKLRQLQVLVNQDLIISDGASLILPIEPIDEEILQQIYTIREVIAGQMRVFDPIIKQKDPKYFTGHITIAYIVQSMSQKEYASLKRIVTSQKKDTPLGIETIDHIELRRFQTMEDWGNFSIQNVIV